MANYQEMSMLDVAIDILKNHEGKIKIHDLLKLVMDAKGMDDDNNDGKTQLYLDITTSSSFVYMGDEEWDLKDRQSLDVFDKDGSDFNSVDDDDEEDYPQFEEDSDDEDNQGYDEDEDESLEDEDDMPNYGEFEEDMSKDEEGRILERYKDEDDDFDEDTYNDYMDDYEDMYDN